jgi:hypothetical protein
MNDAANDKPAAPDPAVIEAAPQVVAHPWELSAQSHWREGRRWQREAEQFAHLADYRDWALRRVEVCHRAARADEATAAHIRTYLRWALTLAQNQSDR